MISLTASDVRMIRHGGEVLEDFCLERGSEYDAEDYESAKKMGRMRRGLLVTGDEQTQAEAEALMKSVVQAELDSWVPDASQRLINRASTVLVGGPILDPILSTDHGDSPGDHALVQDWVCGIFVLRCCTCAHLFKV